MPKGGDEGERVQEKKLIISISSNEMGSLYLKNSWHSGDF